MTTRAKTGGREAMMAGVDFRSYTSHETQEQGVLGRIFNLVGALSSIGLVVGLGYWGYELTVRDVRDIPVIRALEGPARVQPDDPGGQLADHQGLSVNQVQGGESSDDLVNQVVLAPAPIDLDAQDLILSKPDEDDTIGTASLSEPTADVLPDHVSEALALAERLAEGEQLDGVGDLGAEIELASLAAIVPVSVPGVQASPRPASRPKFTQASFSSSAIDAAVAVAIEVDPENIKVGARLVQLGIYDTRDAAAEGWDEIAARFEEYIDGKSRVIEPSSSGGRAFFRLRAYGFENLAASRRFCTVLVASNTACIPVQFK
ncbi:MAG: SPOR domain-containing protein [Litoreibacter sp.]